MTFEDFCQKFRCSVSSKMQLIGHRHMREIEVKRYMMYIDIRTMMPFNSKSDEDCLNCVSFPCESTNGAKRKAYDFIKESGSLELLKEKNNHV